MRLTLILATASTLALVAPALAQPTPVPWHAKARAMFEHAINIPTVADRGRVPELAQYLADQYKAAGIPAADIKIVSYDATKTNKTAALIVRWRAAGSPKLKPIMVMAHMDVVEAKPEDWATSDPFVFTEKDGYYYGRGTSDIKQGIVATTTAILQLKAQGFKPKRDIIVFYTGDEETTGIGAEKGATEWKEWLNAEYGLNADGGGGGFAPDGTAMGLHSNPPKRRLQAIPSPFVTAAATRQSPGRTTPSINWPMPCTGWKPIALNRFSTKPPALIFQAAKRARKGPLAMPCVRG